MSTEQFYFESKSGLNNHVNREMPRKLNSRKSRLKRNSNPMTDLIQGQIWFIKDTPRILKCLLVSFDSIWSIWSFVMTHFKFKWPFLGIPWIAVILGFSNNKFQCSCPPSFDSQWNCPCRRRESHLSFYDFFNQEMMLWYSPVLMRGMIWLRTLTRW